MFEPIDNQKFAQLAGVDFDQEKILPGPVVYSRTHSVVKQFRELASFPPCVLVTSFSDDSVKAVMSCQLPSNVRRWFSNNLATHNPRVTAIPIGFRYSKENEELLLKKVEQGRLPYRNLCYMNFMRNIPRTPNPREGIYELLGDRKWMTVEAGFDHVPIDHFYDQMASHPYTLSPPGAGPDCHRHWEAIALGSIPIVLRDRSTHILRDMPCLQVAHWGEVTPGLLEKSLPNLQRRFFEPCMDKLDMAHWRRIILMEAGL